MKTIHLDTAIWETTQASLVATKGFYGEIITTKLTDALPNGVYQFIDNTTGLIIGPITLKPIVINPQINTTQHPNETYSHIHIPDDWCNDGYDGLTLSEAQMSKNYADMIKKLYIDKGIDYIAYLVTEYVEKEVIWK